MSDWAGRAVTVAGLGVSGPPVARALAARGAEVTAVDARDDAARRELAAELERDGVRVRLGDGETLPDRTDIVVTSPGWRPDTPLLAAAAKNGVPIIGDVELAWRLRPTLADSTRQRWLAVTGTNGKTTTVKMLEAMLLAAGRRAIAAGNVGTPLVDVVLDPDPYDVVAVELSSFQLHWSESLAPTAATVLNVAADHIDWHGSLEAYAADKGRVYAPGTLIIANADDPWSMELAGRAAAPDSRTVTFTLRTPAPDQLGLVEDLLVDRAFVADPSEAAELAGLADVQPAAPHNVANALAAAALARAEGVPAEAVRDGLRAFRPEPHRISHVAARDGVDYVDDSKATNPHAAAASLAAYPSIVWIAGGLLKGAEVDDLVRDAAPRMRAVVALGTDRNVIREAVTRHAPNVPIVDVPGTDTGVMQRVVNEASRLARPGDTVLLAPAAASLDIFANYNARGDAFAAAVRALGASTPAPGTPGT
ncbi:MAG TPA: UDP-N-acetylmuramoyl-L-alanine--D-glutamate ligase [Streptosporangiaceae bacterium]|jgi:UDP-N-acetylmuramoylalanine--D-glutamate ligase